MNTFKTAAVVVALLGVLYGVYLVLNRPEPVGGEDEFPSIVGADSTDPSLAPGMIDPSALQPYDPTTVTAGNEAAMSPAIASGSPAGGPPSNAFAGPGDFAAPGDFSPQNPYTQSGPPPMAPPVDPGAGPPMGISSGDATGDEMAIPPGIEPPPAGAFTPAPEASAYQVAPPEAAAGPDVSAGPEAGMVDGQASTAGFTLSDDTPPLESKASVYSMPTDAANNQPPASVGSPADFRVSMDTAREMVNNGDFEKALETLTAHYYDTGLLPPQREELMLWLNLLSAKVIFSAEHHTAGSRHQVQPGDSWSTIAEAHQVPAMLLRNLNGGSLVPQPGTEVKVLDGPFHAEVNLTRKTVAVFLKRKFATEFKVANSPAAGIAEGGYQVQSHQQWPVYEPPGGSPVLKHSPMNPYGEWRLDLGKGVSLHSHVPTAPAASSSIALPTQEAKDLAAILSNGSKVEVSW